MLEDILELQRKLNLSQGELLAIVQRSLGDDTIRPTDTLTLEERATVWCELVKIQEYAALT